jgi:hypothetical protein
MVTHLLLIVANLDTGTLIAVDLAAGLFGSASGEDFFIIVVATNVGVQSLA